METILAYIFWIIVIILIYKSRKNKKNYSSTNKSNLENLEDFENIQEDTKDSTIEEQGNKINTMAFSKKDYLLTSKELRFYKLLKQIADGLNLNVFCQVAMYEVISCKDFKEFNRIKSKSIDFVITEPNCKILLCIELDDSTHNMQKRIDRDKYINTIFKASNTKLLRIPTQNYYNLEELEALIKSNIDF